MIGRPPLAPAARSLASQHLVHVVFGPKPLGDVLGAVAGVEGEPRENDDVKVAEPDRVLGASHDRTTRPKAPTARLAATTTMIRSAGSPARRGASTGPCQNRNR